MEPPGPDFLDHVPAVVFIANPAGDLVYVNEMLRSIAHVEPAAALGSRWTAYIHQDDRDRVVRAWRAALASGEHVRTSMRYFNERTQRFHWVLLNASAKRGSDGTIERWYGALTDIDKQIRAEAHYRRIVEAASEGIWLLDAEDRTTYVNARMASLLGFREDEMLGYSLDELVGAEQARALLTLDRASQQERARDRRFVRRTGGEVWVQVSMSRLRDDRGNDAGALLMLTDVTARHESERAAALRAEESRTLLESMPALVWTATAKGDSDYFNQKWLEHTGRRLDELVGSGWLDTLHPEDRARVSKVWEQSLETGGIYEVEFRVRRRDGTYPWFLTRGIPLRDPSGEIVRWLGTTTDIDDQKRAAQTLEYLSEAGRVLAQSLEIDQILEGLVRILIPSLADSAAINLLEEDGRIRTCVIAFRDPVLDARAQEYRNSYILDPEAKAGTAQVLRTGRPEIDSVHRVRFFPGVSFVDDIMKMQSSLVVPLMARGVPIGALAAAGHAYHLYTEADLPLFTEIAQRAATAIQNARAYDRERRVANALQQASLPASLPTVTGIEFSGVYQPGRREAQIGGDWYDALRLNDGRVVLSIGDVAGSGLSAAIIMGSMRQVIRGIAQIHADPNLMLDAADKALRNEYPERIVTAFVGVFDPVTLMLTYSSAGHPAPFLRRPDGTVAALEVGGLPLGLRRHEEPPAISMLVEPDSLLALYTDGLIESTRDLEEGERRVREALEDDDVTEARNIAQALHDRVLLDGAHDDVAILTVRVTPAVAGAQHQQLEGPVRRWSFDITDATSAQRARREFIDYLRMRGDLDEDYYAPELVFGELIGNVLRYAAGRVDITLDWTGPRPVLHVLDNGPGFQHVPALPSDILAERGRGLFIVAALTEDFHVARRPGRGSHARAVLALRQRRVPAVSEPALSPA